MNERSTPETDVKASPHIGFYSCATVPADFARQLERQRDEVLQWKKGMLLVERQWDEQSVGRLLGIQLGESIKANIEPKLRQLISERDEARAENKKLTEALIWISKQYDDSKPLHQAAMDAYEMSCIAKAAVQKEEAT